MRTACVYPGTFDPLTSGHLDVIERASKCFDSVTVSVLENSRKTPVFSLEERIELIKRVVCDIPNIKVVGFSGGLLVEHAREMGATLILRGLRAISDFDYEYQMASMNRRLATDIETVFMMTSTKYAFVSSSVVKEIASLGGDIRGLVPERILQDVINKLTNKRPQAR